MAVRIKQYSTNVNTNGWEPTEYLDSAITQREVTVDNIATFHFAPNQVRNFLDEGVGAQVGAAVAPTGVVEDAIPFGSSRF